MKIRITTLLAFLLCACSAWAARPATHITGALLTVGGAPPKNVTVSVIPNASFTVNDTATGAAAKYVVQMVKQEFPIADPSNISIYLIPNTGSGNTPDLTSYTATIRSSVGSFVQTWSVPTTSSAVRVADIIVPSAVSPSYSYVPITGGTLTGKLILSGAPSINFPPSSEPSNPSWGDVYYDVVANALKFYNGSRWVLIGSGSGGGSGGSGGSVLAESNPGITVANTATETSLYSVSIPGGTLGTNYQIRATLACVYQGLAGESPTVKVKYGATTLYSGTVDLISTESSGKYAIIQVNLWGQDSTSAQSGTSHIWLQDRVDATNGSFTSSETSTETKTFDITWTWASANSSNTITSKHAVIEYFGASSTSGAGTVVHDSTLTGDGNSTSPLSIVVGALTHNDMAGLTTGDPHTQYVLKSTLPTTLSAYVLSSTLSSTLANYPTTANLTSTLANYVTNSSLSSTLANYVAADGSPLAGNLNLGSHQLLNSRMENRATDPSSPSVGQFWFNTGSELAKWYDGHNNINPLDRSRHSGTQVSSTISDLSTLYLQKAGGTMAGNLDFGGYQALKLAPERLATDPVTAVEGQIYWNTGIKAYKQYNGSSWTMLSIGGSSVVSRLPITGTGLSGDPLTATTSTIDHAQLGNLTVGDPHPQYALLSTLSTSISAFTTQGDITATLVPYETKSAINSRLTTYALTSDLASYVSTSTLANDLALYLPLTGGNLTGNVSFGNKQLKSARIENVTSNPAGGQAGRLVYRTDLAKLQMDNGSDFGDITAAALVNVLNNGSMVGQSVYLNFHGFTTSFASATADITPTWGTSAGTSAEGNHAHAGVYQPLDADLSLLANVSGGANLMTYYQDAGNIATTTLSTYGRTLIDDGDAATARGTLGLGNCSTLDVGSSANTVAAGNHDHSGVYQPADAELTAFSGVTGGANVLAYFSDAGNMTTCTLSTAGRALIDDASATDQRATLGLGNCSTLDVGSGANTVAAGNHDHSGVYQPADADLSLLAGVSGGANVMTFYTDAGNLSTATLTTFARSIIDDEDASTVRGTIGLGSLSTQSAGNVSISGGSITGTTVSGYAPTTFQVIAGNGLSGGGNLAGANVCLALSSVVNGGNITADYVPKADGTGGITWGAVSGGANITEIIAGAGLTGGGSSGNVSLACANITDGQLSASANIAWSKLAAPAANVLLGATNTTTLSEITCTPFARSILDDPDAAAVRGTLGCGNISTQDAGNVSLVGALAAQGDAGFPIKNTAGTIGGTTRVLRCQTTDATPTLMSVDDAGTTHLSMASNTGHGYTITVTALGTAGTDAGKISMVKMQAAARNIGGTSTLPVAAAKTIVCDELGVDVSVAANDTADTLDVTVTGPASTTVKWAGTVDETTISY